MSRYPASLLPSIPLPFPPSIKANNSKIPTGGMNSETLLLPSVRLHGDMGVSMHIPLLGDRTPGSNTKSPTSSVYHLEPTRTPSRPHSGGQEHIMVQATGASWVTRPQSLARISPLMAIYDPIASSDKRGKPAFMEPLLCAGH